MDSEPLIAAARAGDHDAFTALVTPLRRDVRALCYRMAGSLHDADDLVQETLVRAWRGLARFEGRASLRTWLLRVATSACLDALDRRGPRLLPIDLGPAAQGELRRPVLDPVWLGPCPDELVASEETSPEARYGARESVALAFLAALQLLPPRQRAVLILRDVLGWQASEVADLLELSVAAANSALQRARETITTRAGRTRPALDHDDHETKSLLGRYLQAWERSDVTALVSLLREDATLAMPPIPDWIAGAAAIGTSIGGMVLTPGSAGNFRLVEIRANGRLAFASYRIDQGSGGFRFDAIHVLDLEGGRITAITAFLDPSLAGPFELATSLRRER